ncbi:MAG: hypothetical protein GY719_39305 [bacterium]|nr:hypothetical protein [bacterium]
MDDGNAMSYKQQVIQGLDGLDETDLRRVTEYLAFLQYRGRQQDTASSEIAETAAVYSTFDNEDRRLAEEGLAEYADSLAAEDAD